MAVFAGLNKMTNEEYQEEINRRDEIIDSYKGVKADFFYLDAKLKAIRTLIDTDATDKEKTRMIRALIIFS